MHRFWRIIMSRLLLAGLCAPVPLQALPAQTSVRSVKVLGSKDAVEIEVEASDRIVPQTQVLTGPDRLVIDFPNSVPSNQLRSQSVDRGEVKNLRIGLFQSKPPVTRLVLDLKTAQSYQVFPSGRTVIIKVMGGGLSASGRMDDSASPAGDASEPGDGELHNPLGTGDGGGGATRARRHLSQWAVGDQGQQGNALGSVVRGAAAHWVGDFDCVRGGAGKSCGGDCARACA